MRFCAPADYCGEQPQLGVAKTNFYELQLAVIYSSWEWDHVADVAHTSQVHHAALKAQTEAGVTGGAVFAQIQVELVILFLQSQLVHAGKQLLVVVLTLASADDFADARNQTVHSGNGLAILVQFHIECLDLLWIIGYEYRFLEDLLGQVTLMLSLKIAAPEYLVIKLVIVLFQKLDCFRVGNMAKLGVQDRVETV